MQSVAAADVNKWLQVGYYAQGELTSHLSNEYIIRRLVNGDFDCACEYILAYLKDRFRLRSAVTQTAIVRSRKRV